MIWPPETVNNPASATDSTAFGVGTWGDQGSAVWQESESIAWLFTNSYSDDIDGVANVGSLYIYRLDWSREPLEVRMVKRLVPPESEFSNSRGTGSNTFYSSAVSVSNDGSTLAVGAQGMNNNLGAVYVYTRPEGPGESWGDIEYADGVKLTVAPAPAWGASGTRPFDPETRPRATPTARGSARSLKTEPPTVPGSAITRSACRRTGGYFRLRPLTSATRWTPRAARSAAARSMPAKPTCSWPLKAAGRRRRRRAGR